MKIQHCAGSPSQSIVSWKDHKRLVDWKQKLSLYGGNMIVYIEKSQESYKKKSPEDKKCI